MKKKFLGIIYILYSSLIFYILIKGYLKNFLAPTMQKYILFAMPVLLIIGIVIIFSKENHYKFKYTDLILLVPLIMLFLAHDGKLSTSLARNRSTSFKSSNTVEKRKEKKEEAFKEEIMEEEGDYDFTNVDFDVKDESYQFYSDQITYGSELDLLEGKTIRVRGFTLEKDSAIPKGYIGIGKYIISCCVADASYGGFIAKQKENLKLKDNTWYEVEGILKKGKDGYGNDILYIDIKKAKKIKKKDEELYVYPCFSYGDGSCPVFKEFNEKYEIKEY